MVAEQRTRAYDGTRRRAAAEERRSRILEVATRMFVDQGWAGTRLADVAREAGVSTELVAKAFGGKQGLLMAAFRSGSFGAQTNLVQAFAALELDSLSDPGERLERMVAFTVHAVVPMAPMLAVIWTAADQDAELRRLLTSARERHVEICAELCGLLSTEPVSTEVVDEVAMLTRAETYSMLVLERGWSREHYVDWLGRRLSALLLEPQER